MGKNKVVSGMIAVGALGLLAIIAYFWIQGNSYVTTQDAQTTGNVVSVVPQIPGTVTAVPAQVGTMVQAGQVLAWEKTDGSPAATVSISTPISGLVVTVPAAAGSPAIPGMAVATVIDPKAVWVQANIKETAISEVHPGQKVIIHLDAFPGNLYQGVVSSIEPASQAVFSLFPPDASADFTKVTQRVPVQVRFLPEQDLHSVYPGLSAEVTIYRHG